MILNCHALRSWRRTTGGAGEVGFEPGTGVASIPALLVALIVASPPGVRVMSAQDVQLKATAPNPISPPDGTRLLDVPDFVVLTAENARGMFVDVPFDHRFEVYDVSGGRTLVDSSLVPAGSAHAQHRFAGRLAEQTIYEWRVRAELDGAGGPWSEPWTLETGIRPWRGMPGFADITIPAGLDGPPSFPLGGHGVAFADATGDRRPDFYVTMNFADRPLADLFFVNRGDGTFIESAAHARDR